METINIDNHVFSLDKIDYETSIVWNSYMDLRFKVYLQSFSNSDPEYDGLDYEMSVSHLDSVDTEPRHFRFFDSHPSVEEYEKAIENLLKSLINSY